MKTQKCKTPNQELVETRIMRLATMIIMQLSINKVHGINGSMDGWTNGWMEYYVNDEGVTLN